MPWPTDPLDRPAKIVRDVDTAGRVVGYSTADGGRTGRSRLQFFTVGQVPAFDGHAAFFAVERVRGGSRIIRVLRQVETPPGETVEPPPPLSAEDRARTRAHATPGRRQSDPSLNN